MPTRRHYRRPNPDRRRALELLAGSRYGYSKAILRAHGFSIDMMVELVKAGLATTWRERMVADGRQTDVVRVRITDASRQALAKVTQLRDLCQLEAVLHSSSTTSRMCSTSRIYL
jgi:hypothetical protein